MPAGWTRTSLVHSWSNDFPSHWTFGKRHPQGADFGRVVYFVIRDSPLRSPVRRAVLGFLWPSFDPDGFEDTAYVNDLIGRAAGFETGPRAPPS